MVGRGDASGDAISISALSGDDYYLELVHQINLITQIVPAQNFLYIIFYISITNIKATMHQQLETTRWLIMQFLDLHIW